jgi:ribosomal protein S8
MSTNFILADLVSKLNVGGRARVKSIKLNYSIMSVKILSILYKNGVIYIFSIKDDVVTVNLKYKGNKSVFSTIKIISTPVKKHIILYLN